MRTVFELQSQNGRDLVEIDINLMSAFMSRSSGELSLSRSDHAYRWASRGG
jgi:hypothetical protein